MIRHNASLWLLLTFLKYSSKTSTALEGAQEKVFMEHIFKLVNDLGITWQRRQYTHVRTTKPFLCSDNLRAVRLNLQIELGSNYMVPEEAQQSIGNAVVKIIRSHRI